MEVACSFEDVAQVLADNGYNISDDVCFDNGADLPSVLSALDSPDSFPESPCSDEDIARVLDITRLHSPSLLNSCSSNNIPSISSFSSHESFTKTRDPCITNAVLRNPMINELPNFTIQPPQSLELFTINLNCPFTDESSQFNTIPKNKEHETLNNYFNSSSALSPLSEPDSILTPDSLVNNNCPHNISRDIFESLNEKDTPQRYNVSFDFLSNNDLYTYSIDNSDNSTTKINDTNSSTKRKRKTKTTSFDLLSNNDLYTCSINNTDNSATNSNDTNSSTKRKRKSKTTNVSKPKRRKQDNTTKPPKTKSNVKKNQKKNNAAELPKEQTRTAKSNKNKNVPASKCSNTNKRTPRKTKKLIETETQKTESTKPVTPETSTVTLASPEIGSTNGVSDETKGLRRSSRATKSTENYNFRLSSLVKRVETERKQAEPKQPKGKEKPPPLSKYRRRTANARERDRMKEINDAFEVLKNTLPDVEQGEKQKITKFTVLKLALNYIASLQDLLGYETTDNFSNNLDDLESSSIVDNSCVTSGVQNNDDSMSYDALESCSLPLNLDIANDFVNQVPVSNSVDDSLGIIEQGNCVS